MNKIIVYVCLALSIFFGGFIAGDYHNKLKSVSQEKKEIKAVVKKNDDIQSVSNKAEVAAVIYKDRVVTQYQTVTKEVVKYVERENSNPSDVIWLNADWVRLHDDAANAGNGEGEITQSTSVTDATSDSTQKVGVKSGKVLEIISDNYQAYANCRVQLTGLQKYVLDLNKEFNK